MGGRWRFVFLGFPADGLDTALGFSPGKTQGDGLARAEGGGLADDAPFAVADDGVTAGQGGLRAKGGEGRGETLESAIRLG